MYHSNPAINDAVLVIVNDGNGEMCGATYKQRTTASLLDFRVMVQCYSDVREQRFEMPPLKRAERFEAASILMNYYKRHAAECRALESA